MLTLFGGFELRVIDALQQIIDDIKGMTPAPPGTGVALDLRLEDKLAENAAVGRHCNAAWASDNG